MSFIENWNMKYQDSKLKITNWNSSEKEQHFNDSFVSLVVIYRKKQGYIMTLGNN